MSELLRIAAGWTETLPVFTLRAKVNGVWVPINLTNYTVEIALSDENGDDVSTTGTATKLTQSGGTLGQVEYAPGDDDFSVDATVTGKPKSRSYQVRWKLTRISTGKVSYVPNGPRDTLVIFK